MSTPSASDALVMLFTALPEDVQEDAFIRISDARLTRLAGEDSATARFIRSVRRVAEHLGRAPSVNEYKHASQELLNAGEDVETFARVYAHFGSWPRALEALALSETTTARRIEARFRSRQLGKTWRFTEATLRATLADAAAHFGYPPTTAEFEWWRERQLQLAAARGETLTLPSVGPYRRRWKTWEAALLHFGYSPDALAVRLEQTTRPARAFNPDAHLPAGLPAACLREPVANDGPLTPGQLARLRDRWASLPYRSRYIVTARLGLLGEPQPLRSVGAPLGLSVERIRQLFFQAVDELVSAVEPTDTPRVSGMREPVEDAVRRLAEPDAASP